MQVRSCPDLTESSSSSSSLATDTSPEADGLAISSVPLPVLAAPPVAGLRRTPADRWLSAANLMNGSNKSKAKHTRPQNLVGLKPGHENSNRSISKGKVKQKASTAPIKSSRLPMHALLGLPGHFRDSVYQFVPRPTSSNETSKVWSSRLPIP